MKSPTLARTELFVAFIIEDCARIADRVAAHALERAKESQREGKGDGGWLGNRAAASAIADEIRALLKDEAE